jgi:site-specific recombinase
MKNFGEVEPVDLTKWYAAMTDFWEWAASHQSSLTREQYDELRKRLPHAGDYVMPRQEYRDLDRERLGQVGM